MPHKDREQRARYNKEYGKGWYRGHKEEVIEKRKRQQREIKRWYANYKTTLCCMICGEKHPACLQFHHRNREEKSFNVGDMAMRPSSKSRLINEIAKCDVLCVNCHAKLHWREAHGTETWSEVVPPEE